jgi:acetyl-CoA acetyltransferase
MGDVYIQGVDMIRFGRFPDRSVASLGAEAALLALDDAGLNMPICMQRGVATSDRQAPW